MEPQNKSNNKIGIVLGVIIVLAVAFVAIFSGRKTAKVAPPTDQASTANSETPAQNSQAASQTPPADTTKQSAFVYKNGTYSATGSYMSPGGPDQIAVTLTLANDIITDISVTPEPGDNHSAMYQNKFASGYKQYVIGKNIADVNLSVVSGSSLTPQGFNDALAQIKIQAKA